MIKKRRKLFLGLAIAVVSLCVGWGIFLYMDDCHHDYSSDEVSEDFSFSEDEMSTVSQENSTTETPKKQEGADNQSGNTAKKGYHIHVNLDEHMMYVFKDGQLLKSYGVSGGKANTPSPCGTWRVISKGTWGEGFGGAWLGFNVPWAT